jgi:elongation factor G
MKVYKTDALRNIALVSHQGSGKTTLSEAFLFNTGVTNRLGEVQQGTTISDFEEEEIRRGLSLSTALIPIELDDLKFNFLDAPGYTDFQGEVKNALYVSDMALILLDASTGVQVGTEVYWGVCDEFNLPRMIVVSKADRDTARNPQALIDELHDIFHVRFVNLQLPIKENDILKGVVDLLSMQAWIGQDQTPTAIPAGMTSEVADARIALIEAAAEADDTLLEKYLDQGSLTNEEMIRGTRSALLKRTFVPVVYTSGTANIGAAALLNALKHLAPCPSDRMGMTSQLDGKEHLLKAQADDPLVVYVFKTSADPYVGKITYFRVISGILKGDSKFYNVTREQEERFGPLHVMRGKEQINVDTMLAGDIGVVAKLGHTNTGDTIVADKNHKVMVALPEFPRPVYAVSVRPASQADSAKMGPTLTRICDEDATLQWRQESATKETILEGMGDVHVDVAIKRAALLGTHLEIKVPKVPYRETITQPSSAEHRHKKQSGGAGQFAEVHLRLESLPDGSGFEFENEVVGGAISSSFMPSIEKGIRSVLETGVLAGYPVVDVKAVVHDGKMHPVDSKDIAFQIAGREGFKEAFMSGKPVLLEPIMRLRVVVPETDMGSAIGDLTSRRAHVLGTDSISGRVVITASAPLAEIQRYSNELRSFTQGRGVYTVEFDHYQQVPSQIAEQIIAQAKKEKMETED